MSADVNYKRILDLSEKKMLQFGFRRVSLDEIAKDLKMSKKTIYKHFKSKDEIATNLISRLKKNIRSSQERIESENKNPLATMSKTVIFLREELGPWIDPFLTDIEYELPQIWQDFVKFRTRQIMGLERLVELGIKKKLFRQVNPSIAVQVYLAAIDKIIDPETLKKQNLSFSQAIEEVMNIWSLGVLNEKWKTLK